MPNRIVRSDVLEDLKDVMHNNMRSNMRPGTADSDVNVYAIEYPVTYGLLVRLKKEIERLRAANAA
jgi:hypothetical protein